MPVFLFLFHSKMYEAKILIELYSRYVDDGNIAAQCPEDLKNSADEEAEQETMERIKMIANSIHKSIQVKVDSPTKHEDSRLPILDTKMWLDVVEIAGILRHQILYVYYEKENV